MNRMPGTQWQNNPVAFANVPNEQAMRALQAEMLRRQEQQQRLEAGLADDEDWEDDSEGGEDEVSEFDEDDLEEDNEEY